LVTAPGVVYVVDDDEAVRDSLCLLIELHGFEARSFERPEAFAKAFKRPPAGCVVLDQHFPGTSGIDFLASPLGRAIDLPVILLTGRGDDGIRARAVGLGVFAYFDKPVADHLLLGSIARAVALSAGQA
jgi:two-component system, LuxR family, response regulator FixJ